MQSQIPAGTCLVKISPRVISIGNTIADAVFQAKDIATRRSDVLSELVLASKRYILATAHRAENVDDRTRLGGMLEDMRLAGEDLRMEVLFPMHPRPQGGIRKFGLSFEEIRVIEPVGFMDFLQLESNAGLVLTDSGGVQEETCILGVPCVTLRDNTERPETIEAGANILAGADPNTIARCKRHGGQESMEEPLRGRDCFQVDP